MEYLPELTIYATPIDPERTVYPKPKFNQTSGNSVTHPLLYITIIRKWFQFYLPEQLAVIYFREHMVGAFAQL